MKKYTRKLKLKMLKVKSFSELQLFVQCRTKTSEIQINVEEQLIIYAWITIGWNEFNDLIFHWYGQAYLNEKKVM